MCQPFVRSPVPCRHPRLHRGNTYLLVQLMAATRVFSVVRYLGTAGAWIKMEMNGAELNNLEDLPVIMKVCKVWPAVIPVLFLHLEVSRSFNMFLELRGSARDLLWRLSTFYMFYCCCYCCCCCYCFADFGRMAFLFSKQQQFRSRAFSS